MITRPVLDYVPRLDERNKAHRISALREVAPADQPVYWNPGVVLDQGQDGSCVGHGVVAEYLASPVRGRFVRENRPGPYEAEAGHEEAVAVYNRAKEIDEWEGVNYDGTSVRAGMLVGRERGWYGGFAWAMNTDELRTALREGPVVLGIEVRENMFDPDHGLLDIGGTVAGGHCILATGYTPFYRRAKGPAYRLRNSWGTSWALNGSAYIREADLAEILFGTGGEAAVPTGRHL